MPTPRQLWIDALRSGEYSQTSGALHVQDDGYCCLGVACQLFSKLTGQGTWEMKQLDEVIGLPSKAMTFEIGGHFERQEAYLPGPVMRWLGMTSEDPALDIDAKGSDFPSISLSTVNDDHFTFDQIADLIECFYGL